MFPIVESEFDNPIWIQNIAGDDWELRLTFATYDE